VRTLKQLFQLCVALIAMLKAKGYIITGLKSSFDLLEFDSLGKSTNAAEANAWKSGGYRNILFNIRCPGSLHVVELQLNLSGIEEIKHGPWGHICTVLVFSEVPSMCMCVCVWLLEGGLLVGEAVGFAHDPHHGSRLFVRSRAAAIASRE